MLRQQLETKSLSDVDVLTAEQSVRRGDANPHRVLIKREDLQIGRPIGQGGFGVVYEGKWTGLPVALKFLSLPGVESTPTEAQKRKLEKEAELCSKKRGDDIASFLGYSDEQNVIVMEIYSNGSLYDFVRNPNNSHIVQDLSVRLGWLEDIAAAFVCLHHRDPCIIHRDLKSSNVFLDRHYSAKVGDFGLARMIDVLDNFSHVARSSGEAGLMRLYQPPEVLNGNRQNDGYSTKSDVYSFGVLIQEILTLKLPYDLLADRAECITAATLAVRKGKIRPSIDKHRSKIPGEWHPCLEAVIDLMHSCCREDPEDRPDFREIHKTMERIRLEYAREVPVQASSPPQDAQATARDPFLDGLSAPINVSYPVNHVYNISPGSSSLREHFLMYKETESDLETEVDISPLGSKKSLFPG